MADEERRLTCATYTHARRHPMVLGKIGDWTPPVQITFPQLGVIFAALWVEYLTWRLWAARLPVVVAIVIFIGLPCALAWAVRKARIEGRSLVRAALGWLTYLVGAGRGRVGGRLYRAERSTSLDHARVYVAPGEDTA